MVIAAALALVGWVSASGMFLLQILANQSGTIVTSFAAIVASAAVGLVGLVGFVALWVLSNNNRL